MTVTLLKGDCLDLLPTLPANSIASCITDPPYGLKFMGKNWDHGVPGIPFWREVYRVLKPGAHIVAFGGTRTYHRMACAIEDAGFEPRDMLAWLYGCGFPKSLNLDGEWEGFGTGLKPALEPIAFMRKPLSEPTVAANVLRWGTGALNIDGCRVPTNEALSIGSGRINLAGGRGGLTGGEQHALGRWPANVVHDGSDEVVGAFPTTKSGAVSRDHADHGKASGILGAMLGRERTQEYAANEGSAARFFYSAKASKADRAGSKHPTVKPIKLLQWLARLITPPGGTVLDPFAGSGTTGAACEREEFDCILIERELEYQDDIERRIAAPVQNQLALA